MKNSGRIFKIAILAVTVLTLIAALCSCSIGKKKIDLLDYMEITYYSFDGYATPRFELDKDLVEAEITVEKMEKYFSEVNGEEYEMFKAWGESVYFGDIFEVEFAETYSNLSNGDEIVINIRPTDELERAGETIKSVQKGLGIKFKDTEIKVKVSGLQKANELDLLADVEEYITFSGANGFGEIVFSYPEDYERQVGGFYVVKYGANFALIKDNQQVALYSLSSDAENLSKGDSAVIKLNLHNGAAESLIEHASVVKSTEYTVTTPDLGEYINSIDDISKEEILALKDELIGGNPDIEYFSTYFATAKETAVINNKAKCKIYVFTADHSQFISFGGYTELIDLIRMPDGTIKWSDSRRQSVLFFDEYNPTETLSADYIYEAVV